MDTSNCKMWQDNHYTVEKKKQQIFLIWTVRLKEPQTAFQSVHVAQLNIDKYVYLQSCSSEKCEMLI